MSFTATITLTTAGNGTGPFNLYSNIDSYITPFETGLSKSVLQAGYVSTNVPNGTSTVRIKSTGQCLTYDDVPIVGIPTMSPTPSVTPTITPSLSIPGCFNPVLHMVTNLGGGFFSLNWSYTTCLTSVGQYSFNNISWTTGGVSEECNSPMIIDTNNTATGTMYFRIRIVCGVTLYYSNTLTYVPPSPTPTPTRTVTPTRTPSLTPSLTPSPSVTPSITPTKTVTPTITPTRSITPTVTPSISISPTITPTRTVTPSITPTRSSTPIPSSTPSVTPTLTPYFTPSPTPTNNCANNLNKPNSSVNQIDNSLNSSIFIGGQFTYFGSTPVKQIIKLTEYLTLDNSFNIGSGLNSAHGQYAGQGIIIAKQLIDDKLIIGGTSFTQFDGNVCNGFVRINVDGSYDNTFNCGTGIYVNSNSRLYTILPLSDGKILIGGRFTSYNGVSVSNNLIRINSDGTLDTTFTNPVSNTFVGLVTKQPDGKYLISSTILYRLNSDFSLDTSFTAPTNVSSTLLGIQSTGKILLFGTFTYVNGNYTGNICRLNTDGTLDTTFNCPLVCQTPYSLLILNDDSFIVSIYNTIVDLSPVEFVLKYNSDGSKDDSFTTGWISNTNPDHYWTRVFKLKQQNDNKIIVGGWFGTYNGYSFKNIIKIYPNGIVDNC